MEAVRPSCTMCVPQHAASVLFCLRSRLTSPALLQRESEGYPSEAAPQTNKACTASSPGASLPAPATCCSLVPSRRKPLSETWLNSKDRRGSRHPGTNGGLEAPRNRASPLHPAREHTFGQSAPPTSQVVVDGSSLIGRGSWRYRLAPVARLDLHTALRVLCTSLLPA